MSAKSESKKEKKKRIGQACDFCRSRHLKCDGETVCYQCQSRDMSCVYSPKKRRGPKPKEKEEKPVVKKRKIEHSTPVDTYPVFFVTKMTDYCCSKGATWIRHDLERVGEFFLFLKSNKFQAQVDYLIDAFGYGVTFAFGAQIFGDVNTAWEYAGKAMKLLWKLIFKFSAFSDDLEPAFLEYMILLAEFYSCNLDFTKARSIMSQALTLIQLTEFPADLSARVYNFLMASSTNIVERIKWFEMVNSFSEQLSIFGRINIVLYLPKELDKTQRYIYAHRNNPSQNTEVKYILEAIQFIDSTEDILSLLLSTGKMEDDSKLNYCKLVIYGVRSIIYTKLGLFEIALSWANEAVAACSLLSVNDNISSRIALFYTVTASLLSGNFDLLESLRQYKNEWPLFVKLQDAIDELTELTKQQLMMEGTIPNLLNLPNGALVS